MDEQDVNSPAFEKAAYREMAPAWRTMDDVCLGTRRLVEQARIYLPQYPAETSKSYRNRLSMAILFGVLDRTLAALVGLVFRKEPTLGSDVPALIGGEDGWAENIDQCGTHWTVWAREVFALALKHGHAGIYVDMPPRLPSGSSRSAAAGRRPYASIYEACQIINWRDEVVDGYEYLDLVVLKEARSVAEGDFGERESVCYRVLRPGSWELFEERTVDGKTVYSRIADGESSLSYIPFHPVYAGKTGFLTSRPPLLEIADLSIVHMRKYSDLSVYLNMCRPIHVFKRVDRSKKVQEMSAHGYMDLGVNESAEILEATGAPLKIAREDLAQLEEWMDRLGSAVVAKKTGPAKTATEELFDRVREDSDLAVAARSLKDAIEATFTSMIRYRQPDAPSGGSVELGGAMEDLQIDAAQLKTIYEMTQGPTPVLAVETLHSIMERAGQLPADFDSQEEIARLQTQSDHLGTTLLDKFGKGQ